MKSGVYPRLIIDQKDVIFRRDLRNGLKILRIAVLWLRMKTEDGKGEHREEEKWNKLCFILP